MAHPHDMSSSADMRDDAFDLRVRAELALAFDPGEPMPSLLRHTPWQRRRGLRLAAAAMLVACVSLGALLQLRPPSMVREAIVHEYYERTLRGVFMDSRQMLQHLGLAGESAAPGYPQLMRPCEIEGRRAYHLTTFFEKGGMVTVLAFEEPIALNDGSGWWNNVYWQVIRSKDGRPLVLVAEKKMALTVAQAVLGRSPG